MKNIKHLYNHKLFLIAKIQNKNSLQRDVIILENVNQYNSNS